MKPIAIISLSLCWFLTRTVALKLLVLGGKLKTNPLSRQGCPTHPTISPTNYYSPGSGYLGRQVCNEAVSRGWDVTSLSRRGKNPIPGDKVLSKVNWVKGNADDSGLLKELSKDKDAFVHAVGLLLDSESGLRFANLITSGSQSVPSASATYDSEMRATAFNLLEAAESTKTPSNNPRPFVYVSAAEAGWENNALGSKIEAGMKDNGFFLPRYLEAKRKVEKKMMEDEEKAGIRPIVARPSFMWDVTKFDILPLLPVWTVGNKLNIGECGCGCGWGWGASMMI